MNNTTFAREEAFSLLNGMAIATDGWYSLLDGNQKFWTVPSSFRLDDYEFPNDSLTRFDVWGTDDDGNQAIRCWSKW